MRHSSVLPTPSRPAAFVALVALVAVVGLAAGCSSATGATRTATSHDPPSKPTTARGPSVLLALDAKNAETASIDHGYRVTLTGYGDVLAFTDRPIRRARRTTVKLLADHWDRLFGKDAPNAALSGVTPDGMSVDVAVELTEVSGDNQTMGFNVRGVGVDRDLRLPEHLVDVSLFIDDVDDSTQIVFASTFIPFDSSF